MPTFRKARFYSCVVCEKGKIVETIKEHIYEGPNSFSFCSNIDYSGYKVYGGFLLRNAPDIKWHVMPMASKTEERKYTPGGVCKDCLKNKPEEIDKIYHQILFK
jgi:hypothetical protein